MGNTYPLQLKLRGEVWMPWKECSVMEERMRFVLRRLDGEPMSGLCREFGISRKTGYKIFERYQQDGFEAVRDRSRRPVRYAHQLPETVERIIVRAKQDKPYWGARKMPPNHFDAPCRAKTLTNAPVIRIL